MFVEDIGLVDRVRLWLDIVQVKTIIHGDGDGKFDSSITKHICDLKFGKRFISHELSL